MWSWIYFLYALPCILALYEHQAGVIDWHLELIGTPKFAQIHRHGVTVYTASSVLASLALDTGGILWRLQLSSSETPDELIQSDRDGDDSKHVVLVTHTDVESVIRIFDQRTGDFVDEERVRVKDPAVEVEEHNGTIWALVGGEYVVTVDEHGTIHRPVEILREIQSATRAEKFNFVQNELHILYSSTAPDTLLRARFTAQALSDKPLSSNAYTLPPYQRLLAACPQVAVLREAKTNNLLILNLETGQLVTVTDWLVKEDIQQVMVRSERNARWVVYLTALHESRFATGVFTGLWENAGHYDRTVASTDGLAYLGWNSDHSTNWMFLSERNENRHSLVYLAAEGRKHVYNVDADMMDIGDARMAECQGNVLVLSTNQGSFHLYRMEKYSNETFRGVWYRPEGLSQVKDHAWLELPERDIDSVDPYYGTDGMSTLRRLRRRYWVHGEQIWSWASAKLNLWLQPPYPVSTLVFHPRLLYDATARLYDSLPMALKAVAGLLGVPQESDVSLNRQAATVDGQTQAAGIHRDHFGFRKLLLLATPKVLFAVNSENGSLLWTFKNRVGSLVRLLHLRPASTHAAALVGLMIEHNRPTIGYEFRVLDALTGTPRTDSIVKPMKVWKEVLGVVRLPSVHTTTRIHVWGIVTGDLELHVFPEGAKPPNLDMSVYFHHVDRNSLRLEGYRILTDLSVTKTWQFDIPNNNGDEQIVAFDHKLIEKVSSQGKKLASRRVMYKYLNPNLLSFAVHSAAGASLGIYIVDVVSGSVIYHVQHSHVPEPKSVYLQSSDLHTLAYTYREESQDSVGCRLNLLELWEADTPDVREEGASFSSYHALSPAVTAKSFVCPGTVTALGVTTTNQGVSAKSYLVALDNNSILTISKRVLELERPASNATVVPYSPKSVPSYSLDVYGVDRISSAPTLLESTSLVLCYGLDIFLTRIAPSSQFDVLKEEFDKVTVLFVLFALIGACMVARSFYLRRRVDAYWK